MVFSIIIIYIIYSLVIILSCYYIDLFLSKEQYSKDELKNILPYLKKIHENIIFNHSSFTLSIVLICSSFLGIIIPLISSSWIINSSILYAIIFLTLPFLKKHFEKSQVSSSEDYADMIVNVFLRYDNVIILGFGSGTGASLIYNWGSMKNISFLWFFINIIIVSAISGYTLKKSTK